MLTPKSPDRLYKPFKPSRRYLENLRPRSTFPLAQVGNWQPVRPAAVKENQLGRLEANARELASGANSPLYPTLTRKCLPSILAIQTKWDKTLVQLLL